MMQSCSRKKPKLKTIMTVMNATKANPAGWTHGGWSDHSKTVREPTK